MYRGLNRLSIFAVCLERLEMLDNMWSKHCGQCAILVSGKHFIDLTSDYCARVEAAVLLAPIGCDSCSLRQVPHRGGLNINNLYKMGSGRK